jgi:hypothetical protein
MVCLCTYSVACPVIVYDFVSGLLVNIVLPLNETIYASDTKMSGLYPCAFTLILLTKTENLSSKRKQPHCEHSVMYFEPKRKLQLQERI